MPSVRAQLKEWIEANKVEEDMKAKTLERLYQVMVEMEECLNNPHIASVPVEQVEKWFSFLQFSIVKELTDKEEVVLIQPEEIPNAIESRLLKQDDQEKCSGNDG